MSLHVTAGRNVFVSPRRHRNDLAIVRSEVPCRVDRKRHSTILLGARIILARTRRDLPLEDFTIADGPELLRWEPKSGYHHSLNSFGTATR